jgi:hypothetical protein
LLQQHRVILVCLIKIVRAKRESSIYYTSTLDFAFKETGLRGTGSEG